MLPLETSIGWDNTLRGGHCVKLEILRLSKRNYDRRETLWKRNNQTDGLTLCSWVRRLPTQARSPPPSLTVSSWRQTGHPALCEAWLGRTGGEGGRSPGGVGPARPCSRLVHSQLSLVHRGSALIGWDFDVVVQLSHAIKTKDKAQGFRGFGTKCVWATWTVSLWDKSELVPARTWTLSGPVWACPESLSKLVPRQFYQTSFSSLGRWRYQLITTKFVN